MSKNIFPFLMVLWSFLGFQACSQSFPTTASHSYKSNCLLESTFTEVSVNALLKSPEKYHNHLVKVSGFYTAGLEKSALSATLNTNERNSVWIAVSNSRCALRNSNDTSIVFNHSERMKTTSFPVSVSGRFSSLQKGHLDQYIGSIGEINAVIVYEK